MHNLHLKYRKQVLLSRLFRSRKATTTTVTPLNQRGFLIPAPLIHIAHIKLYTNEFLLVKTYGKRNNVQTFKSKIHRYKYIYMYIHIDGIIDTADMLLMRWHRILLTQN